MADLLGILDRLAAAASGEQASLRDRLAMYEQAAQARCAALRDQLEAAEDFAARLHRARQAAAGKEKSRR